MFIDVAKIFIKAGKGGNGAVSFRREKYVPAGGPDGGNGGKGGDIVFEVDASMRTLSDFRYKRHYKAEFGYDGSSANKTGSDGKDIIIKVPPGTIIRESETQRVIADLTTGGDRRIVARGGKGGKGNSNFAIPTRQAPTFAKSGYNGEEMWVTLELKLIADVGLVGFPNAGKSTLLSVVTEARPKIANYHFTTLSPNLGVVRTQYGDSFVMADIPGLIEGAGEGTGLGHDFLRHIERTRLIVHVVDVAGTEGRDPASDFHIINRELKNYSLRLSEKPQIIAANKTDACDGDTVELFKQEISDTGFEIFPISSVTKQGLKPLLSSIARMLKDLPEVPLAEDIEEEVVYRPKEQKPFDIYKENSVYIVTGAWIERLLESTNLDNHDSLQYFQRALKSRGVIDALENLGINEGETVKIYDLEFDYIR